MKTSKIVVRGVAIAALLLLTIWAPASLTAPSIVLDYEDFYAGDDVSGTAYGTEPIEVSAIWTDTLQPVDLTDNTSANGENDFEFATDSNDVGRTMRIEMTDGCANVAHVEVTIQ